MKKKSLNYAKISKFNLNQIKQFEHTILADTATAAEKVEQIHEHTIDCIKREKNCK